MKTIIIALFVSSLVACGDNTQSNDLSQHDVQSYVQEMCGSIPSAPGWAVAFENVNGFDRALLTREDMQAISAWRTAQDNWNNCLLTLNGK